MMQDTEGVVWLVPVGSSSDALTQLHEHGTVFDGNGFYDHREWLELRRWGISGYTGHPVLMVLLLRLGVGTDFVVEFQCDLLLLLLWFLQFENTSVSYLFRTLSFQCPYQWQSCGSSQTKNTT